MSLSLREHVVKYIHHVWGSKEYFPGPQPISIERRHFQVLRDAEYVVCEKTDGERHMMVALMFEGKPKCVFVNRSFDMFEVKINLNRKAYEGTIIDGELYDNTLMVYDSLLVNGSMVGHFNLDERLAAAEEMMKFIIYMKSDKHRLKMKTFHMMKDFRVFMDEYLPTVQQKIDGLVFTPMNEPIRIGTHETMFKWKPQEQKHEGAQSSRSSQIVRPPGMGCAAWKEHRNHIICGGGILPPGKPAHLNNIEYKCKRHGDHKRRRRY